MAAGDRCPALLLLLLWAAASVVSGLDNVTHSPYSVCNTRCCKVEPNCSAALHVKCHCDDEPMVILRSGDFPPSVESIEIWGVRRFKIYEHALLNLTALGKVDLRRIDKMMVYENGFALQRNVSPLTLSVGRVKKLELASSAFSGFWDRGNRIRIGYVSRLYIRQHAFSFLSSSRGPGLIVEQTSFLDMSPKAFNAPFRYLTLAMLNMKVCRRNTFGPKIRRIEMIGLNMTEVREGCIDGTGVLHWLSISDSRLGVIRRRGIHGKICNVRVRDSRVSRLQPNGIQLNVGNLTVVRSNFTYIMTRGFDVIANNSIHLNQVNIHLLYRHALIALQVRGNQANVHWSLSIDDLTVRHAESASLAFDKETDVKIHRLSVQAPNPPVCPIDKWIRQLSGTTASAPLGRREQELLAMLQRDWLCRGEVRVAPVRQGAGGPSDSEEDNVIVALVVSVLLLAAIVGIIACKWDLFKTFRKWDLLKALRRGDLFKAHRSSKTKDNRRAEGDEETTPASHDTAIRVDGTVRKRHIKPAGNS